METNEKLRREISQLSNLIAASSGGNNSSANQMYSSTRARTSTPFSIRQYASNIRLPFAAVDSSSITNRNIRLARYPNPFDAYARDGYANQVFPNPSTNDRLSKLSRQSDTVIVENRAKGASPYKLDNSSRTKGATDTNSLSNSTDPVVVNIKKEKTDTPTSVYINPSYLAKVNSTGELALSIQSNAGVRPHINPAHSSFHLLTNNYSNSKFQNTGSALPSDTSNVSKYSLVEVNALPTSSSIGASKGRQQMPINNTNNSALKTKYKLDRRLKRSPTRTLKVTSPSKLHTTSRTKLFKRYSMRVVSTTKLSPPSSQTQCQNHVRKAQRYLNKNLATIKPFLKRYMPGSGKGKLASIIIKKGRKSIVHIDGSKFLRKNGGKSLKRVKSRANVVNINGNRFITKNGGKSLKRLSESQQLPAKVKTLLIHSQQQPTPGVRLANRAIQKSKIRLSQRTWKKKQQCMYYSRFGECKRKDNGSCPYVHDRKQLMICPKFIVEKCTDKDCKLSHDMKLGRMPPCQFFNKSKCSRENCPYPHIKTSPLIKKPADTVRTTISQDKTTPTRPEAKLSSQSRKRFSARKDSSSEPRLKKKGSKKSPPKSKNKDPNARYYEQAPDSQPIVSIIPRRFPKNSTEEKAAAPAIISSAAPTDIPKPDSVKVQVGKDSDSGLAPVSTSASDPSTSSVMMMSDRRSRLMSKISRLHDRVKKKESTAPQFLAFN